MGTWGMRDRIAENGAQAIEIMRDAVHSGDPSDLAILGIDALLPKPVRQSRLYDTVATVMGAGEVEASRSPEKEELRRAVQGSLAVGEERPPRGHILLAEDNLVNQRVAMKMP